MEDRDSMELFINQLDDPFDDSLENSQNAFHKSPIQSLKSTSIFEAVGNCSGHDERQLDLNLLHMNPEVSSGCVLGVYLTADDVVSPGLPIFIKALNTLEHSMKFPNLKSNGCDIHFYLGLLRLKAFNQAHQSQDFVMLFKRIKTIIGPVKGLAKEIGVGTASFGSKGANLYMHALLGCHLTFLACHQHWDLKLPLKDLLEFLVWMSILRIESGAQSLVFNCSCVKHVWNLTYQKYHTDQEFWLDLASFFEEPVKMWALVRQVVETVDIKTSDNLLLMIQDRLKPTLLAIDRNGNMNTLKAVVSDVAFIFDRTQMPPNVAVLGLLWDLFFRQINEDEKKNPFNQSGPKTIAEWKQNQSNDDTAFAVFLKFVYSQLKQTSERSTKVTQQFLGRIRSKLPQKVAHLNPIGITKAFHLILSLIKARLHRDTKPITDVIIASFEKASSHRELILRGIATCCSVLNQCDDLFTVLMTKAEIANCPIIICELLLNDSNKLDQFLDHPAVVSTSLTRQIAIKPPPTIALKQLLTLYTVMCTKFGTHITQVKNVHALTSEELETRSKIEHNMKLMKSSIYPTLKHLWTVSSVEDLMGPFDVARQLCDFVLALNHHCQVLSLEYIKLLSRSAHPSFLSELTMRMIQTSGKVEAVHLEAWIRCEALLKDEETADVGRLINDKFHELKRFQKGVETSCQVTKFFLALNNKINLNESNMEEIKSLRTRFSGCFDAYADAVAAFLPKLVSHPFGHEKVQKMCRIGGILIKYCSKLMYNPGQNINKLGKFLELMYVNAKMKDSSVSLTSAQKSAVKQSLPETLDGIGALPKIASDRYFVRVVADIVVIYLRRYSMDHEHPLVQVFRVKDDHSYFRHTVNYDGLAALVVCAIRDKVLTDKKEALNGLELIKLLQRTRGSVCQAVIEKLLVRLLQYLLSSASDQQLWKPTLEIVVQCAIDNDISDQIKMVVTEEKLQFHREPTFRLLRELKANRKLMLNVSPHLQKLCNQIELKVNGVGIESLKTQIRLLNQF